MPESVPIWLYLISIILAALPGLYATWRQRKRTDAETGKVGAEAGKAGAEAAQVLTTVALDLVAKWIKRVESLELEVTQLRGTVRQLTNRMGTLEDENQDLWQGAARLANQVMEMDGEPVWLPGDQRRRSPRA